MDPATMSEGAKKMTRDERTMAVYHEIMEELSETYEYEGDDWFDIEITADVVESDV